MANNLTQRGNKASFSMKISSDAFQRTIKNTLQDPKRSARFTAAVTSAVANSPDLQRCDAATVLSAALLGESLNLSPSPQLGQYYMVPFEDRRHNRTTATFVLGYKGYIQLALRSGYYKKLNVVTVKDGELRRYDPFEEVYEFAPIEDFAEREAAPTAGYYAFFEYENGFKKSLYWTKEKMEAHALQYSKAFAGDKKRGTSYSFWSSRFDEMAMKTMLRQLISKWGIMSIEMQTAFTSDGAVIHEDGITEYVDDQRDEIREAMADVKEVEAEPVEEPVTEQAPEAKAKAVDLNEL